VVVNEIEQKIKFKLHS